MYFTKVTKPEYAGKTILSHYGQRMPFGRLMWVVFNGEQSVRGNEAVFLKKPCLGFKLSNLGVRVNRSRETEPTFAYTVASKEGRVIAEYLTMYQARKYAKEFRDARSMNSAINEEFRKTGLEELTSRDGFHIKRYTI